MKNKFPLLHLLLYSKGWYKKFHPKSERKTIWDDLRKVMTADGYYGEAMSISDIVSVILNHCQQLKDIRAFELSTFVFAVHPLNCWKYGYLVKGDRWQENEEYDYFTAVILYCISELRFLTKDNHDKLPMPDYKNCLPSSQRTSAKTLKKFFQ